MEEEQKVVQPTIGEYQGKPIIRIPTVDKPNPETTWHWLSFGKNKAKAIVKGNLRRDLIFTHLLIGRASNLCGIGRDKSCPYRSKNHFPQKSFP